MPGNLSTFARPDATAGTSTARRRPALDPTGASFCAPGDVVTVTRIDRLARCTFDLFPIVKPPRRDSNPWRNHGPTPAPTPGA